MTKKIFFIILALIISSAKVYPQQHPTVSENGKGYEYSYDPMVFDDEILVSGNANDLTNATFQYSLNGIGYKDCKISKGTSSTSRVLSIDTLNLTTESNELVIWYNKSMAIDTITINYSKPIVKVTGVMQNADSIIFSNKIYVANKPDPVTIKLEANQNKFSGVYNVFGKYGINKLQYKLVNDLQWIPITNASITTSKLKFGENWFDIRAVGDVLYDNPVKFNNPEYSDTLKVCIFYIDFTLPKELKGIICPVSKNYNLIGSPEGGYFSGSGIIGKSFVFNPSLGKSGENMIVYNYDYNGTNLTSLAQQITIDPEYKFSIIGPEVVCKNSIDQNYSILGSNNNGYIFDWIIEGGISQQVKGNTNIIHWDESVPAGSITVKAFDESDCYYEQGFVVHIKDESATAKSYPVFIDADLKLLVCTDTSAKTYRWIKVQGDNEIQLGSSVKPYFYNSGGAKSDEIYYVETAYDSLSCFTRSYPCNYNNNWNSDKAAYIPSEITEPAIETNIRYWVDANCIYVKANSDKKLMFTITDMNGRNIYQGQFNIQMKLNKNSFATGSYIFSVRSENKYLFKSVLCL